MGASLSQRRRLFSICIPAYNRAHHLRALLDSIFAQNFEDFEIVVCEDNSPEREQISSIVRDYSETHHGKVFYYENEENLGYDANIRNLVEKATGQFCFFMGNDDMMCSGALSHVSDVIRRHNDVGLVLKSYALFDHVPENITLQIRYFNEERIFTAGPEAIRACFRRSGVISGYIISRDSAHLAATSKFDGSLYYQMHLTAQVLSSKCAVFTPQILVWCRKGEPPDFGNSKKEKGKFVPGRYTPEARLHMLDSIMAILEELKENRNIDLVDDIKRDYANYFYVYIKDQLTLPPGKFIRLYRDFGDMGFHRYPMFHLYFVLAYLLGEKRFDSIAGKIRGFLGRSPNFT
jgi:abequosyltransferase